MTERPPPAGRRTMVHHQPSHDQLLRELDTSRQSTIDAIIVPSARRVESLGPALRLANVLDCPALVLCSGASHPGEVVDAAMASRAEAIAVDFRDAELPLVLESSRAISHLPHGEKYHNSSLKRNVGLLVAHMTGTWRRVLYHDDDIEIIHDFHARAAAAWLSEFHAVGLEIKNFPDNSVVCHASREAGNEQSTFIGGGALAVHIDELDQFFPDIYNEDWLFIADAVSARKVGRLGMATQAAYDPFAEADRAWFQEFGDCIAEGVYASLHVSQEIDESLDYWTSFLADRAHFIAKLRDGVTGTAEGTKVRASLDAAAAALQRIEPIDCVQFLRSWASDKPRWRKAKQGLPVNVKVHMALAELNLHSFAKTQDFPN
ncbi:hypothetical protein ACQP2Y_15145 [Actinoplanes sp. CA-051413]|uniref:hypothetical protein n=1 Tax=Actinoplanes sp. CA-051413 TaxID=3239899 RepID=UPI003D972A3F